MISVGPNLNLQKAQLNYKPKPVKHGRMYQILIYSGLVSRLSGFELKKESENPTKGFVSYVWIRFVLLQITQTPLSSLRVRSFFFFFIFLCECLFLKDITLSGYCVWFQFITGLYQKVCFFVEIRVLDSCNDVLFLADYDS